LVSTGRSLFMNGDPRPAFRLHALDEVVSNEPGIQPFRSATGLRALVLRDAIVPRLVQLRCTPTVFRPRGLGR
jgi:hypothetical protein